MPQCRITNYIDINRADHNIQSLQMLQRQQAIRPVLKDNVNIEKYNKNINKMSHKTSSIVNEGNYITQQNNHSPIKRTLDLSPSRKTVTKSPLSNSKAQHINITNNNKSMVSYGELQILLENIAQIKSKANSQIRSLEDQNTQLKTELDSIKDKYEKLRYLQQNFEREKEKIEERLTDQKGFFEKDNRMLQERSQLAELEVKESREMLSDARVELQNYKHLLQKEKEITRLLEDQTNEIVGKITNNNPNQLNQILHIIERSMGDDGIMGHFEKMQRLEEQGRMKDHQIRQLQNSIEDSKNHLKNTTSMAQKMMEENRLLSTRIQELQNNIRELEINSKEHLKVQELAICSMESKSAIKDMEISSLTSKLASLGEEKHQMIDHLNGIIKKLQEQIKYLEGKVDGVKEEAAYEKLIDGICGQSQDYAQVIGKMQYMQRFKTQHYFNVQKIQFLCKMLDQM